MKTWTLTELDPSPRRPQIISSTDDARAIVVDLAAGESLDDHVVHERAWLVLIAGELEVTSVASSAGPSVVAGPGLLVEFDPAERHRVDARSDARFLLMLTPWPGTGHPGALTIEEKSHVRERAAERRAERPPD
jgi:Cupin domain